MTRPENHHELRLVVGGNPRFPTVALHTGHAVAATGDLDRVLPAPGGCVEALRLEGDLLGRLPRANCWRLLRRARRLLTPGGRLTVAVGGQDDQIPREELARAAWICGFDAGHRYAAGHAVLAVPARGSEATPLVSILIPAYKGAHFATALYSALAQSWPRCEIVVGDDSPDERIARVVAAARSRVPTGWSLRYIRNQGTLGGRRNYLNLFAAARGRYVKYLNDDDLLAPDCVERMAVVLRDHPQVTLVTSYRRLIDATGRELPDEAFNAPVLPDDGILDGRVLATLVLSRLTNLIGEPTTTMFRKADIDDNTPHLMSYAGRSARRNGDMSIWTTLLSRGDAAWLGAPLSCFRQHGRQVQRSETFLQEARLAWVELVGDARDTGLLSPTMIELAPEPLKNGADADLLTDRGEAAHAAGEAESAAAFLRSAVANAPRASRARGDLACLAWEAGRHEEAVLGACLALACPEPDGVAAMNLRDMLGGLGRTRQADAVVDAFAAVFDAATNQRG